MPELESSRRVATARRRTQEDIPGQGAAQQPTSYFEDAAKQDRIRKWQSQNVTEAVDPDVLSVKSQPRSEAFPTPIPPRSPDPQNPQEREAQSTPRRRSTKWVQQENKSWVKQKRSVRGDQRKDSDNVATPRVSTKVATPPRAETPSAEFFRTVSQRTRNVNSSRAERDERRRRRRRESRARADGGNALVDDGIRVYMRSESRLASEADDTETARAPSLKEDDEDHRTPEYKSQLSFKHDGSLPSDHEETGEPVQSQPSRYAQTLGRPPEYTDDVEQPKNRKRAILTKTKGIFVGKHDVPQTSSNRIPSIEAWLEEQPDMPDPFVDKEQGSVLSQKPVAPKSLKHKSHRKKVSIEPTIVEVDDPNKIWESINQTPENGERKNSIQRNVTCPESETSTPKRRLFSFEVCDEPTKGDGPVSQPPEYAEYNDPQTMLKRKDAKSTRRERQSVRKTIQPLEVPSDGMTRENSIQADRDISPKKKVSELPQVSDQPVSSTSANNDSDVVPLERIPSSTLKRKLTTHEDLLSVLSRSRTRKSTRSSRRAQLVDASSGETIIREALQSMREEEAKYVRELRTLVDGVTPVLLQSLLSKEDAVATAGLFSENNKSAGFTRPVIDMGIALQRLKQSHLRIPLQEQNVEGLLTWAVTAHKHYTDYVKSWRLGFQGVIVNLAPLHGSQMTEEEMLARDIDGDVTNDQGEKVDVAYLQKRPLVRIKRLSKLFATILEAMPTHEAAKRVADMYADLTETAKQRHSEEQGRLEDEAAANIDATRVRDVRSMAPLESVEVDKKRRVRARDFFDMSVCHSTGQRLDCKVELILRDDPEPGHAGGDVLICQVEEERKWLLFQPILLTNLSSRRDQSNSDLVLMVRGAAGIGTSWMELIALSAEDPAAVTEWLHMLGSNPLPPRLNHIPSWHIPYEPQSIPQPAQQDNRVPLSAGALAQLPSDVDIPIGEPSVISGRHRPRMDQDSRSSVHKPLPKIPQLSLGGGLQKRSLPEHYYNATSSVQQQSSLSTPTTDVSMDATTATQTHRIPKPSSAHTPAAPPVQLPSYSLAREPLVPQQRYAPQKFSQLSSASGLSSSSTYFTKSDTTSRHPSETQSDTKLSAKESGLAPHNQMHEPLMSGALPADATKPLLEQELPVRSNSPVLKPASPKRSPSPRPTRHSRAKSSSMPLTDTIREQWAALSGLRKKTQSIPNSPEKRLHSPQPEMNHVVAHQPASQHVEVTPRVVSTTEPGVIPAASPSSPSSSPPPPPPPHHGTIYTISSPTQKQPLSLPPAPRYAQQIDTNVTSPLKHEYQPSSSASDSESESDETDATSEMSEDDFRSELKDEPTPLVSINQNQRRASSGPPRPLPSIPSTGTRTLAPSDSASNGPYRRAPPPSSFPAHKKKKTIALVCSWSEKGLWEPIRDEECSIVISPGLVQAFPMSAAHSQPMAGADWEDETETAHEAQPPLVEFELTPVVPLRKGTALDITIRSPPTSNSIIRATNNVMFRSRTVQECEKLYQLINWARCNNPTYAQLARSRAREQTVTFATNVPQSKSRSWFSFGSREKKSYRASSRPPTSIADSYATTSSTSSAFAALKKFGKNSPFSLNRSSVIHRPGLSSAGGSLYSSSNTGSGSGTSTPAPSQSGFVPGPEGPNVPQTSAEAANGGGMVNNMKIRLFLRQGQKWEALGPSLLTVLPAAVNLESRPDSPNTTPPSDRSKPPSAMPKPRGRHFRLPSSDNTPHRIHGDGREKRLLITATKSKDVVLLDEVLGESCFEKVMQTGIAVNVWREDSEVQEYGGVMTGRSRTYMMQFRTSTEASWVFNMCGTYRYGSVAVG